MTALQSEIYKRAARKVIREIDAGDFWSWMQKSKPGQCKAIAKCQNVDKVCDMIGELKENFFEQTETQRKAMTEASGKGKGKEKGKPYVKPAANGKAVGKGKGKSNGKGKGFVLDPNKLDEYYMPFIAAFKNPDGSQAEHVRQEDDHAGAPGLSFGMPSTHLESILQLGGITAPHAKAKVIFGKLDDMHAADKEDIMMTSYRTEQIQFPMAMKRGDPIELFDAVLINLGATMIEYKEAIAMVTKPAIPYTAMSIRIHKSQVDAKVYDNLKHANNFKNYLEQVISKEWLVPEATAKTHVQGTKAVTINGEVDEINCGLFFVHNDKAHAALKRSGHKGVTI